MRCSIHPIFQTGICLLAPQHALSGFTGDMVAFRTSAFTGNFLYDTTFHLVSEACPVAAVAVRGAPLAA